MAYEKLVKEILKDVGGKENINGLTHCITRLRFNLKDEEKANTEELKEVPGVVTVVQSGDSTKLLLVITFGMFTRNLLNFPGCQQKQK